MWPSDKVKENGKKTNLKVHYVCYVAIIKLQNI